MKTERDGLPAASDVRKLADRQGPIASLFVPVTANVPERSQNQVRLERAIDSAAESLRALGSDASVVERAKKDLAPFLDAAASPAHGIAARAAFWSEDEGGAFFGLPFACSERVAVASTAVLRPMLRAARRPDRYRLLRLSANRVELFEGDASGLARVEGSPLPASLEDALGREVSEPNLQFHSSSGGGERPLYHGQGGASRAREVDFVRFHQLVAEGLEDLAVPDPWPLVLAAEARHRPALEAALHRDVGLLSEGLDGNPDHLSVAELHQKAWPVVAGTVREPRAVLERAREDGGVFLTELSEIVQQAVMGTLRRVWLPEQGTIPGRIDRQKACAEPGQGDDDLVESLAAEVLRRGGEVLVLTGEDLADDPLAIVAEKR